MPDHLPGQAEFDATATHLGAAYESAWLACLVLADDGGQAALVRLYEQVSRGRDLDGQLRGCSGLTEAELTDAVAAAGSQAPGGSVPSDGHADHAWLPD